MKFKVRSGKLIQFSELAGLQEQKRIPVTSQIRTFLIEQVQSICERCNQFFPYPEIHHIDGDGTNNDLDNLMVLCPNCHVTLERQAIEEEEVIR
jgi:hypothetical protein